VSNNFVFAAIVFIVGMLFALFIWPGGVA